MLPKADVVIAPLMQIVGTGAQVDLSGAAGVIFTSRNGVDFAPRMPGLPAWCVGDRTAEAARLAGFAARSVGGDVRNLQSALAAERPSGRLVHLHGRHVRGDLVAKLSEAGLDAEGREVYDQVGSAPDPSFFDALARNRLIVPLFSPRSAKLFATAAGPRKPGAVAVVMSPAVRDALPQDWQEGAIVAEAPSADAMVRAVAGGFLP